VIQVEEEEYREEGFDRKENLETQLDCGKDCWMRG
jgi:hypothetical protein